MTHFSILVTSQSTRAAIARVTHSLRHVNAISPATDDAPTTTTCPVGRGMAVRRLLRHVHLHVIAMGRDELQIFDPVVHPVSVPVVNNLGWGQTPPQKLFHDNSMFLSIATVPNHNKAIARLKKLATLPVRFLFVMALDKANGLTFDPSLAFQILTCKWGLLAASALTKTRRIGAETGTLWRHFLNLLARDLELPCIGLFKQRRCVLLPSIIPHFIDSIDLLEVTQQ